MKKLNLTVEQKVKIGFVSVVAIVEIILMFLYKEISVFGFVAMFLLYVPDAIISFIRHDNDRWIDLSFLCLYFILTLINILILL